MLKDSLFPLKSTLNAGGRCIDLSKPLVMGILNLTPDSFYEGSRLLPNAGDWQERALAKAAQQLEEGASFIDLGAYSTRPGASDISANEEADRLLPVLEALHKAFPAALLSVDTFRATVAEQAVKAGALLVNDVSGGNLDAEMFATVARLKVPYVLMHMRGTPASMQSMTQYSDLVSEVIGELLNKAKVLERLGVKDIILDPGFGFAKTIDQNFTLLRQLDSLAPYGYPVLVGLSRKSMIYKRLNTSPAEALNGTTVLNTLALSKGARILRVHDVKEAVETIKLYQYFDHH